MDQADGALFVAIVESGSLAGGARLQNISASLASRRISRLEADLQVRLLNRSTRHLSLTEAGRLYLDWARGALEGETRLLNELQTLQTAPTGRVSVAVDVWIATSYFAEILKQFNAEYPRIMVTIVAANGPPSALGDSCDLAIHVGEMPAPDLIGQRAYNFQLMLLAAPTYVERYGQPETPAQLAEHRCIDHVLLPSTWTLRSPAAGQVTVDVERWVESDNWLVVRTMAIGGLGIIRMGGPLLDADVAQGLLVRVLPDFEAVHPGGSETGLWIIYANARPAQRVRLFARFVARHLRHFAPVRQVLEPTDPGK
jgi:DNA-binding transcriptional LysR family regulator